LLPAAFPETAIFSCRSPWHWFILIINELYMKRSYCKPGNITPVFIARIIFILLVTVFCFFTAFPASAGETNPLYDIVIENGRIIDGTGNPWYFGDIGITGDRIIRIGSLKESPARRRINAHGMFISPGFIDIHTHSDDVILRIPLAESSVRQGITTIVAGNCGGSTIPVSDFLSRVEETGLGINYIILIGHNAVRRQVMGTENRAPTSQEMSGMKQLIDESMKAGAFGLSTGLYYTPGYYATTEEIIELARVVAGYDGIYASHIRDESDYNIGLLAAIEEAVSIGEKASIRVQISHLKCLGKPVWHKSDEALELIGSARARGVNVMFDQYPYTASSTSLWGAIFPAWAQEGGGEGFLKRLENEESGAKIRKEIRQNIDRRGGAHTLLVIRENAYLSELAEKWNMDPVDAAIRIQNNGGSGVISFNMTDYDLENILVNPYGMIGSDGSVSSAGSAGHPRSFGTFPRILGVYVREKNILTWEEAIRKMTSAPANQLGLFDRGVLRPGMLADIVIFDPEAVTDTATYEEPSQYPEGIPYVLINGKIVIDKSNHTGIRSGMVLRSTD
jgi:N-acyl-D-amino-acid deacylase